MNKDLLMKMGFIKIPFLDPQDVKKLINIYETYSIRNKDYNNKYAEFTVLDTADEGRDVIRSKICEILLPKIESLFPRYKVVLANFVVKEPKSGVVPIHQNWSVVDENTASSFSFWIPLIDCTKSNGTLEVIKSSHLSFRGYRGLDATFSFIRIQNIILYLFLKTINTKAGEALIFDDSIIHYSRKNNSNLKRIAVQVVVTKTNNKILFPLANNPESKSDIDIYEVCSDFYQHMKNWKGDLSQYKTIGKVKYSPKKFNILEFLYKLYFKKMTKKEYKKIV